MPQPKLSLRLRLFILTAVALVPALAILIYNEVALRRSREAEIHALALRLGQSAALEMQSIIEGSKGQLLAVAFAPSVRSFNPDLCVTYLQDVQTLSPHLTPITVLDSDGKVRCRADAKGHGENLSDRAYFQNAIETGQFIIGGYTVSRISGKPTLPMAAPIRNESGAIIGVLAAGLNLEWLGDRLRQRDFAQGSALTIADRGGYIIAREPFPERFIGTRIPDPFLSLVNGKTPGTQEVLSQDGTTRVIGYIPATVMPNSLYISAGISKDEAFRAVDQATRRGAALVLVGAIIAFLSAWLFGRSFVRDPVARLVDTIKAWREGDLSARTGMSPEAGELETVGADIDLMMDEIAFRQLQRERAEERQRLLLNELNHRVKNTLATVQFIVAQSLRTAATPGQARESLEGRLIALARAHDVLTREQWEGAELKDIVSQAIEPFQNPDEQRWHVEGPEVRVSPQTALALAMTFQELATNAVKYGALSNATGQVRITWSAVEGSGSPGNRISIRWEENGGPLVRKPTRRGFGSRLLERALAQDLGGEVRLDFVSTGVVCTVEALTSG
ncbi:sensor histidine kinase [Microvirga rosea]|uniref:sensor histidine kinase n=1 Tax=Microvirga rosea TaxID=2715425 RepID=UPI001D09D299|nr:HWE histidine kinase domain-containing protein [Microvirga rosea]MCB8820370.1 sensor histidine kinase [Microvirga rosea]